MIGNCPTCKSEEQFLYDTESDEYLNGIFDKLILIYSPEKDEGKFIKNELLESWDIFAEIEPDHVYEIIKNISKELYFDSPELFEDKVINTHLHDFEYLKHNSMLQGKSWHSFVQSLKHENRFHTKDFNTEILEVFCTYIRKVYKVGQKFYRGRISPKIGYQPCDMSAPPIPLTLDGRANSTGIRRLYLSNDLVTTLYEVRAGAFDFVTVGEFVLKKDIVVVDLEIINKISPFIDGLDCAQYYVNKELLNRINTEMGRPLRRGDSNLDYLPTQYITDFIQSLMKDDGHEYSGVEYKSAMNAKGFNLAIFDPDLFECIETHVYQIDDLLYETTLL